MTFTIDNVYAPLTAGELEMAWNLDPLGIERGDYLVVDRLEIVRIALVASEAGARFQRDGTSDDPLRWLLTASPIFQGRPPIEACRRKDACSLAILVQGLGLPLDLDPEALRARLEKAGLLTEDLDGLLQP